MNDMFGSKKPNLLPSSSQPPLGPISSLLKKPNYNSNHPFHPAIEALITRNNSQQDKNKQLQAPYESSTHSNNNVTLNVASSKQYQLEVKNQHESIANVSDPYEESRRLRRYIFVTLTNEWINEL